MLTPDEIRALEESVEADEAAAEEIRRDLAALDAAIEARRIELDRARAAAALPGSLLLVSAAAALALAILVIVVLAQMHVWCR
jgi:hypothetical protein